MVDIENMEFSCFGIQNIQNAGVGSGVDFKIFPEDTESQCLYTSGEVLCKTGWGTFGEKILCPPEDYFNRLYPLKYFIIIYFYLLLKLVFLFRDILNIVPTTNCQPKQRNCCIG